MSNGAAAALALRLFHIHNANTTLMRTDPAENAQIGKWIAEGLNRVHGPVRVLVPESGRSALLRERSSTAHEKRRLNRFAPQQPANAPHQPLGRAA